MHYPPPLSNRCASSTGLYPTTLPQPTLSPSSQPESHSSFIRATHTLRPYTPTTATSKSLPLPLPIPPIQPSSPGGSVAAPTSPLITFTKKTLPISIGRSKTHAMHMESRYIPLSKNGATSIFLLLIVRNVEGSAVCFSMISALRLINDSPPPPRRIAHGPKKISSRSSATQPTPSYPPTSQSSIAASTPPLRTNNSAGNSSDAADTSSSISSMIGGRSLD